MFFFFFIWHCVCGAVPVRRFHWLEIHPDKMKCWCERGGLGEKEILACVWRVEGGGWIWGVTCLSLRPACHVQHQSCSFTAVLFHPPFPLVLWRHNSLIPPCGGKCYCLGSMCVRNVTHCHIFVKRLLNCGRDWIKTSQRNYYKWEEQITLFKKFELSASPSDPATKHFFFVSSRKE